MTNVFRDDNRHKAENMNERQPTKIRIISVSSITYLTISYIVYEVLGKVICSRASISTQQNKKAFPQRLLFTVTLCFRN